MSLINDALKRAGSAPPPSPSAEPGPAPPPMQPAAVPNRQPVWPVVLLPIGIVLVLALAGGFFWRGYQARRHAASSPSENLVVARETTSARAPSISTEPTLLPPKPTVSPAWSPGHATVPTAVASKPDDAPSVPAGPSANTSPALPADTTAHTNSAPPRATSSSLPVLKLQGIVYRPSKPSVMINNKTLFVGETIGDAKIVAIDRTSVTVECQGQTRVLTLP